LPLRLICATEADECHAIARGSVRVKLRKARYEQMFSALPPIAEITSYDHGFNKLLDTGNAFSVLRVSGWM
jgi:hypothetical protein